VFVGELAADFGREVHKLARGTTDAHDRLRRRVATAILLTLAIDAVGTALMYVLEHGKHDKHDSGLSSVWKACFWVTAQLLTVSSQMQNPVTTGGRIVDLVLELWSITIVTTLAGSVAAFFHARDA
jgi:hypothetical protein